jgi:HNH endonuclease
MIENLLHHCTEDADCFLWRRACCNGHPAMKVGTKTKLVRRVLWESANGPIPVGCIVRVTCGHALCINPKHTELTTYQRLGKQLGALGVMSGPVRSAAIQRAKRKLGKLSIDDVRAIRASDETGVVLAAKYGVAQAHISKVRLHKSQIDYHSPFAGLGARA